MGKFKFILFTTAVVSLITSSVVYAYSVIGYKLSGGVKDRYYTISSGNTLASSINAAVSNWNNIDPEQPWPWLDKTDVNFIKSDSTSASQLDYYTSAYGTTGWYGFTYYFNASGADNPGGYPTANYTKTQVKLNTSYTPTNSWQAIAAHEMGHALGLKHNSGALMDSDIGNISTIITTTTDDIDGIRSIY